MARENFLWGAPRIHGVLLMLGFEVSQATVSRYLSTLGRNRSQSWRTFIRNQAIAFPEENNLEHDHGERDLGSLERLGGGRVMHEGAGIAKLEASAWLWREPIRPRSLVGKLTERPGSRAPSALLCREGSDSSFSGSRKSRLNQFPTVVHTRGPPHHVQSSSELHSHSNRQVRIFVWTKF